MKEIKYRYFLRFDMHGASENGRVEHPQRVMIDLGKTLGFDILYNEPVSIASCWLFIVESKSPWLSNKLPKYIDHEGYPSDANQMIKEKRIKNILY